jgi:nucleoid-associated protein YgaU
MRMLARGAGGLVWVGALLTVALAGPGEAALAPPPLEPSGWAAWAAGRTGVDAVFGLARLGVLALAWYLLVVTGLGVLARLPRARPLARAAHVVTLPAVRRALDCVLGASLAAGVLTGPAGTAPALAGAHDIQSSATSWDQDLPGLPFESPAHLPTAGEVVPTTWTVAAGEHFWSIAEAVVGRRTDRTPTTSEVARYWAELIEVNRPLLPDPSNPDLLYPGIALRLPDPA